MANPILDDSGVSSIHGLHESRSTQEHDLGTGAHLDDGRHFVYALAPSGGLAKGSLYIKPAVVANHENNTVNNAVGAGERSIPAGTITIGATAMDANEYRDGYLVVTDADDQGSIYRIREHAAIASAGNNGKLVLYDALDEAWTTSTTVSFVENGCDEPTASATLGVPLGVATGDVTAAEYGWIQDAGPANTLIDGTPAAGAPVIQSNAVAGAVEVAAVITTPIVGTMITTGVDTEYQLVDIKLRG